MSSLHAWSRNLFYAITLGGMWICPWSWCAEEDRIRESFQRYEDALSRGDVEMLRTLVSSEKLSGLTGDIAEKLSMIRSFRPVGLEIHEIQETENHATLKVEGTMDGNVTTGTVTMVKEQGEWKVDREDWKVELTMETPGSESLKIPEPKEVLFNQPGPPPTPQILIQGLKGMASSILFTPDSKFLVGASYDEKSLKVWDLTLGERKSSAEMKNRPGNFIWPRGETGVLTSDVYHHLIFWPVIEGFLGAPREKMNDAGNYAAQSPNGMWLATACYIQGSVVIWQNATGKDVHRIPDTNKVRRCAFSPDNKLLVGTTGNILHLWDTTSWKSKDLIIPKVDPLTDLGGIAFSPNGKFLGMGFTDSSIIILDVQKRKIIHNFFVRDASTWDILFSPNSNHFMTAHQDGKIYFWHTLTGKAEGVLQHHQGAVRALALSPDGKTLASSGEDKEIVLWRSGSVAKPYLIQDKPSVEEAVPPQETGGGKKSGVQNTPQPSEPLAQEKPPQPLPEWFQVDGVMGDTVNFNGSILVEKGAAFTFSHDGIIYELRLLNIEEDHVDIQNGNETIRVPLN